MATRTWTLKIRGDSGDAVRAADKVDKRFKNLNINKGLESKMSKLRGRFNGLAGNAAATGRKIAKGLALGAAAGLTVLGAGLVAAFKGFEEHRKVMAKTT